MTFNEKLAIGLILLISIPFTIITFSLQKKLNTYESALDNTVDATIMEIDNLKGQIQARNRANAGDRLRICGKLIPKLKGNVPYKYIQDGTCEAE